MTTTLERVARAICGVNCFRARVLGEPCLNADSTNGPCKANETQLALGGPLQAAKAALQALRQVDDETVEAMANGSAVHHTVAGIPCQDHLSKLRLTDAFTAAIDHILGQGGAG